MTGEDLDSPPPVPGLDECERCSLEWWNCICDPARPNRQPTPEEIEAARSERDLKRVRSAGMGEH
jgi:hypothetical protein